MFKRLKELKDLLWAAVIALALLFVFGGFLVSAILPYHGDRTRPVMDLRGDRIETENGEKSSKDPAKNAQTLRLEADGTLHPLAETAAADQSYLDALCFLCDSGYVHLRGSGLTAGQIWSSESGQLPMGTSGDWTIRYPGDASFISPVRAASVARPDYLIIAIGSDALTDLSRDDFIRNYTALIQDILSSSKKTSIACLSICPVTASYVGADGLDKDKVNEVNGWIKTVCTQTGVYYGDLNATLCGDDGYLRSEFSDSSGRSLNSTGLKALLNYLAVHDLRAQ